MSDSESDFIVSDDSFEAPKNTKSKESKSQSTKENKTKPKKDKARAFYLQMIQ